MASDAVNAAFQADVLDPRHGTANGYRNLRCRCTRCKKAWAVSHLDYMHRHPEQLDKNAARARAKTRERRRERAAAEDGS